MIHFPVSGVDTYWWVPVLVAFAVSTFSSMGGLSGAFLLLPFQVSVLGFGGPAVSPTNLIFNIVAIPSGVYRYYREGRMVWPLVWVIIIGTLPGVFLGAVVRIRYLSDPSSFKLFAGFVLAYVGLRLCHDIIRKSHHGSDMQRIEKPSVVSESAMSVRIVRYRFNGISYQASTMAVAAFSFAVGLVGGAYGIGGGAIIAPFLMVAFGLPVYTISGAALAATFVTSIAGVTIYTAIAQFDVGGGIAIGPDWLLGVLFGLGGAAGMYVGARLQRYVPARMIKGMLAVCVVVVAVRYILGYFW